MVRGLGWLGAVQIVSAGVWQAAGIALATILGPNDFGFFGLAMIAIAVVAIPGDLGLTVEVVRREDFDSIVSTARRLRWFIAAGLSGIALLMGAAVAIVFEVPSFLWVVAALSTIFPATALAFGPRASLTRSLDFRSLAIADTSGKLAGPISSVALALLGFGYWSLAFGFLASTWISALSVWLLHPVKANRPYDRALARILITSGKFVSTAALFGFLLATADNIAVGGAFGVAALGVYSLSYSLGVSVPRNASSLVDTVLFPAFSRMNKDIDRLRRGYLTTMRYVAYFIIPAAALFANLPMHVAQSGVRVVVEIFTKDKRRYEAAQVIASAAGQRSCLEPGVALPGTPLGDEILFERRKRRAQGARVAVGAQAHIDAKHEAVGRGIADSCNDATSQPIEKLLVADVLRADGCAGFGKHKHQVDVG